ncbi:MAG: bssD [Herbinix sp.]|nr:bssD [Herbinix sp.]
MEQPLVTNIQKYSIHDGEGIRTTVFFKGCPLSCTWCHNPETQSFSRQLMFQKEGCTGCGSCVLGCPNHAISMIDGSAVTDEANCTCCGSCLDYCLQNIREISGKYFTIKELITEVEKDKAFYEQSGGGITLSGGEVLCQNLEYLTELLRRLKEKGYRVNLDTCGYAPFERFRQVIPFTDTFLYDLKIMDTHLHKEQTGVWNDIILDNLIKLSREGANLWLRIPVIGGINNTRAHMECLADFLKREKILIEQIHLLPYHNTGSNKYMRLNQTYKGEAFTTPDQGELNQLAAVFHSYGFHNVVLGG